MVYEEVIPFARERLQSLNTTLIEHIYRLMLGVMCVSARV
jgi:hypothetical protein